MIFTLIGMPGAGKSCMGKYVSRKLGLQLIDSDKLIEERFGKRLQVVLDEIGVVAFRKAEEEVLLSIDGDPNKNYILSTGGSAVYSEAGMEYLRKKGKVIYLYCSCKNIISRIKNPTDRGIVLRPGQTLDDLFLERTPLYSSYADITFSVDGTAYSRYQKELVKLILEEIEKAK